MRPVRQAFLAAMVAAVCAAGCTSSPAPGHAPPPANSLPPPPETGHIVAGAADSIGAVPGSVGAQFIYAFKMIEPASDRFSFQDRDLSFAFRPSPTALFIQIENRQDHPVWINWDHCSWLDAFGSASQLANAETRWSQRYATQPSTQIAGLQRYSNYLFPIGLLVDPGGSPEQLHRPLFPEDQTAPQFVDREFGARMEFRIADRTQAYIFRFKVRSVQPR